MNIYILKDFSVIVWNSFRNIYSAFTEVYTIPLIGDVTLFQLVFGSGLVIIISFGIAKFFVR